MHFAQYVYSVLISVTNRLSILIDSSLGTGAEPKLNPQGEETDLPGGRGFEMRTEYATIVLTKGKTR